MTVQRWTTSRDRASVHEVSCHGEREIGDGVVEESVPLPTPRDPGRVSVPPMQGLAISGPKGAIPRDMDPAGGSSGGAPRQRISP